MNYCPLICPLIMICVVFYLHRYMDAHHGKTDTIWARMIAFYHESKGNLVSYMRPGPRMRVHCTLVMVVLFGKSSVLCHRTDCTTL
jgi:hypothetical protein